MIDAYLSVGVRECDFREMEIERIEGAGNWLATTKTTEDVDVVGALLGKIEEIKKIRRSRRKDEL